MMAHNGVLPKHNSMDQNGYITKHSNIANSITETCQTTNSNIKNGIVASGVSTSPNSANKRLKWCKPFRTDLLCFLRDKPLHIRALTFVDEWILYRPDFAPNHRNKINTFGKLLGAYLPVWGNGSSHGYVYLNIYSSDYKNENENVSISRDE